MTKFASLTALSLVAAPFALAAEKSYAAPGEAVGFGALMYGFTDPTTLVAFGCLIAFLVLVWYVGGFKLIFGSLDARADAISKQLDEAKAMREEAARIMSEAEQKAKEADATAADIVARAKADADAMLATAEADLATKVARREAQAEARIARAEADASAEVRRVAADAATKAAGDILSGGTKADDLFDKALSEIEGRMN
jgi:F-type H+-transporting ATPase subunit b